MGLVANFIKYVGVIGCAVIAYPRILALRKKESGIVKLFLLLFVFLMASSMVKMQSRYTFLRFPLMVFITTAVLLAIYRTPLRIAFVGTLFSYAIGYLLSVIVCLPIFSVYATIWRFSGAFIPELITYSAIVGLQFALEILFFRMSVWKNSEKFLYRVENSNEGMVFSGMTLVLIFLLGMSQDVVQDVLIVAILVVIGLLFGLLLWLCNRFRQENTNRSIKRTFKELDKRINDLETTGQKTELLLHRQNRFFTAISRKSRQFARQEGLSPEETRRRREFSEEMDGLTQLSGAAVESYTRSNGRLPATHIPMLDEALRALNKRAAEQDVNLQLLIRGDPSVLSAAVGEADAAALISALLENELDAVSTADRKYIVMHIWADVPPYRVEAQDTGGTSETDFLSGPVPMLCRKHGISLEREAFPGNLVYSERVSLCFDGQGKICLP